MELEVYKLEVGAPLQGVFGLINWANGPYFLKTEIDTRRRNQLYSMGERRKF